MQGQREKIDWNNLACLRSVWSPVADLRITKVKSPFILLKSCALALKALKKNISYLSCLEGMWKKNQYSITAA